MSTKLNPADHLIRGVKLEELVKMDSWRRGPFFLLDDQESWPKDQNILRVLLKKLREVL